MSRAPEALRDEGTRAQVVTAGAIAGLVSRFCIAPLDVLKIRLQLQYHSLADPLSVPSRNARTLSTPQGVLTVAREILRHEGISGFWKGNIPAEGLYLSYGAVQFLVYRSTTQALDRLTAVDPSNHQSNGNRSSRLPGAAKSFIAGALAGSTATAITYPLDLLRTRFAAQGTEKVYEGLAASVRDITRYEGPGGFFRGVGAGVGQVIPYMGLFFALYEGFKPAFSTISLPFGSGDAFAGTAASVLAKSAVFPLDTVRKRLQVQGPTRSRYIGGGRIPVYEKGILHTMRTIVKKEGTRGLYRGLGVSLIKAAPTSAVTMWTYERALHVLQAMSDDDEL